MNNAMRQTRKKRGLTLRDLSKVCGIHISSLSRIESGKYLPGDIEVTKIAKALKVTKRSVLVWYFQAVDQRKKELL